MTVTEKSIPSTVEMQAEMFSRVVLDTSRTRVRTFGSDDAGHLVGRFADRSPWMTQGWRPWWE